MASKQPLYTAVGFVTWQVGKRAIKRKLGVAKPRRGRKLLLAIILLGGAGAGAYAVTSSSSGSSSAG